MNNEDLENARLLSSVLIVLSIVLLYCWYRKKVDNMANYTTMRMSGSFPDHFQPNNVHLLHENFKPGPIYSIPHVLSEEPGLHWKDGMTKSMHDNDTAFQLNRETNKGQSSLMPVLNPQWKTDSRVNDNDGSYGYDPMEESEHPKRWGSVKLPSEIITRGKNNTLGQFEHNSMGKAILTMSDFAPQYGDRNYSDRVSI